jgi:2-polyprenyl-6-methoxyphenol hydroxylase-like FAD-dependent oxidoreductase
MKIAIIGGGIGGLTLAIALQRKGFAPTVYEQAPELKMIGAGLGLSGNAIKAFSEIGIAESVLMSGTILKRMAIKDAKGRILNETNSEAISKQYGIADNFSVHRADLHDVLLQHVNANNLSLGKVCIDFKQTSSGIKLFFQEGTSAEADYVIASDGIHSVFRKKLLPNSLPRYAGYTCWRAVIEYAPANFDRDQTSETWGPGARFGIVPLSHNRLYWFATLNAKPQDQKLKSYTTKDLLKQFQFFHHPIPEIISNTKEEQLIWSDINDLEPINQFAFNNILLLGDAAHATTPNMGQGACMAIEDAATLANSMERIKNVEGAFRQFEKKRIERTTKIVNTSWKLGKISQLTNPLLMSLRNVAIRATPSRVAAKQIKFLQDVSFE